MDVLRPDLKRKNTIKRRTLLLLFTVLGLLFIAFLLFYRPGPKRIDSNLVSTAHVKKGEMLVEVSGAGSLVPAEVRWISAPTGGRIEKIYALPGTHVRQDTIVMELSNPELEQSRDNLSLQLESEQATFISFKSNLENNLLETQSRLAGLNADYELAVLEARINRKLYQEGLESQLSMHRSTLREEQLKQRLALEKKQLGHTQASIKAQTNSESSRLEQTQARLKRLNQQVESFKVKALFAGILQKQTVQVGHQVTMGQNLAQVTNPDSLKAVLKISEHLARDIEIGQKATINTRIGLVSGQVQRIDPNVEQGTVAVDIELTSALPEGARPDQSIEGSIEVFRLADTVYVDRPSYAQSYAGKNIFKLIQDTQIAEQVKVRFGRVSVNTAQIESGLSPGDEIVISDTTDWDDQKIIKIK